MTSSPLSMPCNRLPPVIHAPLLKPLLPYTALFRSRLPQPRITRDEPLRADVEQGLVLEPRRFVPIQGPGAALVALAQHVRSEEHTSELQSPCNVVCCLLLEKKKNK